MASAQCCKSANESYQQKSSLCHKVSEMAGRVLGGHHPSHHSDASKYQTEVCYSQTTVVSTHSNGRQAATHATCQRMSGREHRKKDRNLLEKIKDRISGHSSDSSSSESDSDNETCRKGKD